MRISDWSSDVCSSDLTLKIRTGHPTEGSVAIGLRTKLLRVDLRRVIRADRDNIELRLIDIREIDLMRLGVGGDGVEIHGAHRAPQLQRHAMGSALAPRLGLDVGDTPEIRSDARRAGKECVGKCRYRW